MSQARFFAIVTALATALLVSNCGPKNSDPASSGGGEGTQGVLDKAYFDQFILPMIEKDCGSCHESPIKDYSGAMAVVVPKNLARSALYQKAIGKANHTGGVVWEVGSVEEVLLNSWIMGAQVPSDTTTTTTTSTTTTLLPPTTPTTTSTTTTTRPTTTTTLSPVTTTTTTSTTTTTRQTTTTTTLSPVTTTTTTSTTTTTRPTTTTSTSTTTTTRQTTTTTLAPTTTTTTSTTTTTRPTTTTTTLGNSGEQFFDTVVLPNLNRDCTLCHDNPGSDYATAKSKIVPGSPAKSWLWAMPSGTGMNGKKHSKRWKAGSAELNSMEQWINMEH